MAWNGGGGEGLARASVIEALNERLSWTVAMEIGVTLVLAMVTSWLFKRFVLTRFEAMAARTENDIDDRLLYFVRRFYNAILAFVVLVIVLKMLGVELTPLLAGAGIAGIAIAYAAKDIIGNFLSGILLLVDQPIKIGDRIHIESIGTDWGGWGDVVDVGLRTTTVRNTDGVLVTYPNGKLAESVIKNFSPRGADKVRFRIRVLVELEAELERALALMVEAAGDCPLTLPEPAPQALVWSLYDQSGGLMGRGAQLELRVHVDDIRVRARARSEILLGIQARFLANDIPFARLDGEPLTARDESGDADTRRAREPRLRA